MKKTAPPPEEIERWNLWFAAESNNLAWTLAENPALTPDQQEEMLNAAHASAFHWNKMGAELNIARAEMLLGQVHAMLGNGSLALTYARRSYEYIISLENSPDWEIAMAHAVLAHAAWAAKEMGMYAKHYALAMSCGGAISDSADKEVFQRILTQIPKIGSAPCP